MKTKNPIKRTFPMAGTRNQEPAAAQVDCVVHASALPRVPDQKCAEANADFSGVDSAEFRAAVKPLFMLRHKAGMKRGIVGGKQRGQESLICPE